MKIVFMATNDSKYCINLTDKGETGNLLWNKNSINVAYYIATTTSSILVSLLPFISKEDTPIANYLQLSRLTYNL